MHSPDHSTKGTPLALGGTFPQWPLTAGKYAVSGSVSSPSRGAFHLSLTVLVHYRSHKIFSLGGWSPLLPTNSPWFVVLRMPAGTARMSSTRLSRALAGLSNPFECPSAVRCAGPTTPVSPRKKSPVWAAPISLATTLGISLDFCSSGY